MVRKRNKHIKKKRISKGPHANCPKAREIKASTAYETCSEQLSPFGGILALIKFLDLVKFKEIFDHTYQRPQRDPKLGHYRMVVGILIPLFMASIGGYGILFMSAWMRWFVDSSATLVFR